MRTYLRLAAVAASALVVALPMTAQAATVHVLTIGKVGGKAVAKGAVLKAGLASGTNAIFKLTLGSTTYKATCTKGAFASKVTKNPAKPGKATESVTAQSFSSCTLNTTAATLKSLKAVNLPWVATVSDASGFPVKVIGSTSTKPVSFTATVSALGQSITCTYTSTAVKGHASNTGNKITFSGQKFAVKSGSNGCPTSSTFSATFGPVKDTSVTGSPKVFVN